MSRRMPTLRHFIVGVLLISFLFDLIYLIMTRNVPPQSDTDPESVSVSEGVSAPESQPVPTTVPVPKIEPVPKESTQSSLDVKEKENAVSEPNTSIQLCIVMCSHPNVNNEKILTHTSTLIKSLLISASLWKVGELKLFIFVENFQQQHHITQQVKHFLLALEQKVQLSLIFNNVRDKVHSDILESGRLSHKSCSYAKLFLPDILPENVTKILYLETDTIITGNIRKIWNSFANTLESFNMIGMVQSNKARKNKEGETFKGVAPGVMFMDLEKMRNNNWTIEVFELYQEYKKKIHNLNFQHLLNLIIYRDSLKLKHFTCHLNFQNSHCEDREEEWECAEALKNPEGIQILNGDGGMFEKRGSGFMNIYEKIKRFDLDHHRNLANELAIPLKKYLATGDFLSICSNSTKQEMLKSMRKDARNRIRDIL